MNMDVLWWVLSGLLIVAGIAGTVLPALPGPILVLAGVALVGAAIGTVVGLFMGFVGVLFMPLVGAAAGEYLARRDQQHALRVGVATWLGILAGLAAKVVIGFMMVGVFLTALVL